MRLAYVPLFCSAVGGAGDPFPNPAAFLKRHFNPVLVIRSAGADETF